MRQGRATATGKNGSDADGGCRQGSNQRRSEQAQTKTYVSGHVDSPLGGLTLDGSLTPR